MDVALDSALEAFPEEELVRRDHIVSLMTNFKTALARAKEAETRVSSLQHKELEGGLITGYIEGGLVNLSGHTSAWDHSVL